MFKNYVFDLYGTLVDIRTNEWKTYLWKKMSEFYGFYQAKYTPMELKKAYIECIQEEEKQYAHADGTESRQHPAYIFLILRFYHKFRLYSLNSLGYSISHCFSICIKILQK